MLSKNNLKFIGATILLVVIILAGMVVPAHAQDSTDQQLCSKYGNLKKCHILVEDLSEDGKTLFSSQDLKVLVANTVIAKGHLTSPSLDYDDTLAVIYVNIFLRKIDGLKDGWVISIRTDFCRTLYQKNGTGIPIPCVDWEGSTGTWTGRQSTKETVVSKLKEQVESLCDRWTYVKNLEKQAKREGSL